LICPEAKSFKQEHTFWFSLADNHCGCSTNGWNNKSSFQKEEDEISQAGSIALLTCRKGAEASQVSFIGFHILRALTVWFCQSIFAKRIHEKEEELVQENLTMQGNEANDLVGEAMFERYHLLVESYFCCQDAQP
jgi:hypothetical protein